MSLIPMYQWPQCGPGGTYPIATVVSEWWRLEGAYLPPQVSKEIVEFLLAKLPPDATLDAPYEDGKSLEQVADNIFIRQACLERFQLRAMLAQCAIKLQRP